MKKHIKWKPLSFIILDSISVTFSVFVCYYILEPYFAGFPRSVLVFSSLLLLASHHIFASIFDLYHRAWEYASVNELMLVVKSVTSSVVITAFVVPLATNTPFFFRLYLLTWMMHIMLIGGTRLMTRVVSRNQSKGIEKEPTLIVGAGDGGALLMRQMREKNSMNLEPVVAVDDDEKKQGMFIHGVKVGGTIDDIETLVTKFRIKKIIIAIPTLPKFRLEQIYTMTKNLNVQVLKMPNIEDIMSGTLEVNNLKKVDVEDLLGREPVELDIETIRNEIEGETILVTGAGGSIGSEITRQVSRFNPSRIILLGHGENSIYQIHQELSRLNTDTEFIPVIADIQDKHRMREILATYKPHVVYHAAAHKHVPMMEYNPLEAVKNNIFGTKNTAEAAVLAGVKKFVMISTDKAVNPPNVMGATKRVAEMVIQNMNVKSDTDFIAVRFGNVLGSRGSVIPLFKSQIERGGPVTVTDPRMTRYFMTIPEASRLVLQASTLAIGGEVLVLDMGEPVKIVDLATKLIRLSGFNERDIKIEFSGMRPGEKLYEELLGPSEIHPNQIYEKIYRGKVRAVDEETLTAIYYFLYHFIFTNEKSIIDMVIHIPIYSIMFMGLVWTQLVPKESKARIKLKLTGVFS
ncbi:polysaccharide biosynthesis protein EpsC [Phocicoccus schoeneichii]|uniref:UDP-N-acetyl-alpha-D-glucosamine C6 dehydratase n=1 Tax=Phocicoccus schoeneichii TaxID=1812261 RepID=A0A6V7R5W7_9BACL|nr:nucleoside-diphosphate sugar epimerase/dehydratase [Jeotgalicoccus schoeneichii]GGH51113.1 polysaccharide biosynthesis protein EpsC [Jeotgalicoccus schoeneichii]CAD2072706.1 UDP-N-acetyl-alpha-D-glucosamine C6 dehydratase [Jeotgalicoccus schoeneichii]